MAASSTAQSIAPPRIASRYRIEEELGRGGLGAVYRATETPGGRAVALKTLERVTDRTTALFEREYHVLASLKHPSVIEVYDFGLTDDGKRYYTMEILPGEDIVASAPIPWRDACRHVRDIAASLALLHGRRLLHRDVSPRNIRFDSAGRAKLLDFGALANFGVATEIVGTPMCISPEVVRQVDLDQRSDLFSLGVVLYFALTGRKPFLVKTLKDVEAAVAIRPSPPSTFVTDVPRALDQLVLGMVSADRDGRPSSAAEIMERLSAIADLEEDAAGKVAQSHLLSTALCGRERELSQLSFHVRNAVRAEGGVVVVEGSAGMGKSRLMSELLISARLAGMTTLRVNAMSHTDPLGVVRALGALLIEKSPAEAMETLAPHFPVLWQALPEARQHMRPPSKPPTALPEDANERRAKIQQHFVRWTMDVAARRPLLIVVDDAHAADTTSAGVLCELALVAREARLLLVTTTLLGAESPQGIQQLAKLGARIKLRGLALPAVEQLLRSAFGEAPNLARLTQWLFDLGHGNPGRSLALVSHLIGTGSIRYAEGAWVLPSGVSDATLPRTLEDAMRARVRQLSPAALRLARLLAVHSGLLTLSFSDGVGGLTQPEVFAASAELSMQDMVTSGESPRLTDESLRAVLLEGLGEEEVRELHLSLGRAMCKVLPGDPLASLEGATPPQLVTALHAGYHLAQGGDDDAGPALLRISGLELTHRGEGLAAAIPALERALASPSELKRSRQERGILMVPLTLAGSYVDFRLTYRYGDQVMDVLAELTGMDLAMRLKRFLGTYLALAIALPIALMRYPFVMRRDFKRTFSETLLGFISMSPAILGVATPLLDSQLAQKTLIKIGILKDLPEHLPPRIIYEFCVAMKDSTEGRYAEARNRGRMVLAKLMAPGAIRRLPEDARQQFVVGTLILVGALDAYRTDGAVHECLDLLDRNDTSVAQQTAAGIRASYHANRGERELFEHHQRTVDALAARSGSTWRQDILIARNLWWPHALCEDVMGLKHLVRQLESLLKDAPSLRVMHDAAHAYYLVLRGMHLEALQRYGKSLEAACAATNELNMRVVGTLARVLRANGRPEKAEELCRRSIQALTPEQLEFEVATHGVEIERVHALWESGRHDEAKALIDQLLDRQESHDNPLLHALNHKARAVIALREGDKPTFRAHLAAMEEWVRRTENPSLVAQCQALGDEGAEKGMGTATRYGHDARRSIADTEAKIRAAFGRCRGPSDRLRTALDLVMGVTGAERGYLYLVEKDAGLRFAAPLVGQEPPDELKYELAEKLDAFCQERDDTAMLETAAPEGMRTVIDENEAPSLIPPGVARNYSSLFLVIPRDGRLMAVGAIALIPGEAPLQSIDFATLEEIARGIYDAADVHTVFLAAAPASRNSGVPASSGSFPELAATDARHSVSP